MDIIYLKGCSVIGFVGSEEKLEWCKNELGFDHVFNYKKVNYSEAISKVAPNGVDIFFDNVGGDFFHTVVSKHMKLFGRVCICGLYFYEKTKNSLLLKSYVKNKVQSKITMILKLSNILLSYGLFYKKMFR